MLQLRSTKYREQTNGTNTPTPKGIQDIEFHMVADFLYRAVAKHFQSKWMYTVWNPMLIGPIGEKGKERDNGSKPLNKQKHMTSKPYIYIYNSWNTNKGCEPNPNPVFVVLDRFPASLAWTLGTPKRREITATSTEPRSHEVPHRSCARRGLRLLQKYQTANCNTHQKNMFGLLFGLQRELLDAVCAVFFAGVRISEIVPGCKKATSVLMLAISRHLGRNQSGEMSCMRWKQGRRKGTHTHTQKPVHKANGKRQTCQHSIYATEPM